MAGEKSVLSGEAGQKITQRLLKLCGWQIAEHIDFECNNYERHKAPSAKGDTGQHGIDGIQCYNSPLDHSCKNLVLISSKHHTDAYPEYPKTKLNKTAKDLAQAIECAKTSSTIGNGYIIDDNEGRNLEFDGLVTFFSSSPEEEHTSFFKEKGLELSIPSDDFDSIFFLDNKRATFLYSAILAAKEYSGDRTYSFIYPATGANLDPEHLTLAGGLLPLELMCSDVLPILIQKDNINQVLIFCNDSIEDAYLKRIIWLAHRICGFAERTVIFFPDYDPTVHDRMINTTKQAFAESNYISSIQISKWDDRSFIKLKEECGEQYDHSRTPTTSFPKNEKITAIAKITEDYDKILPYGEMLKPILSSTMLGASDLKNFLKRKGIFVKYADKELIVPIFAGMILSPCELDYLKGLLVEKEEKPKSLNQSAPFVGQISQLRQIVAAIQPNKIPLRLNCEHLKTPRFIDKGENRYELEVEIERRNTNKDLISGKTRHTGRVSVLIEGNRVHVKIEFSSTETKSYLESVALAVNAKLKETNCINQDLRSIKFKDFPSNRARVEFLTGFAGLGYEDHFSSGEIVNIKFKPDEKIDNLPNELNSYRGRVRNLDINGNLLEQLPHIELPEYQDAILLSRVKIRFKFALHGNSGYCVAEIDFPSTLNGKEVDEETDMQISVEIQKHRDNRISDNIPRLQNQLSRLLDKIVLNRYSTNLNVKTEETLAE